MIVQRASAGIQTRRIKTRLFCVKLKEKIMEWIKARAVEPSTWRGVGWLLVSAGVLPFGSVDALVSVGVAVVGVVEIIRKEIAK